jgi:hypothetical protein
LLLAITCCGILVIALVRSPLPPTAAAKKEYEAPNPPSPSKYDQPYGSKV